MKLNAPKPDSGPRTHEGGRARHIGPEEMLRRSVLACLLWEKTFYEDGVEIAERICGLVPKVSAERVSALAVEARTKFKLRHAPLLLSWALATHHAGKPDQYLSGQHVADTIEAVVQRADELAELLAIHFRNGRKPIPAQMKKGLARAFPKFDAYQLAKYDREGMVRLRDVLRLCHPSPPDEGKRELWGKLLKSELPVPDTWEVALRTGGDKKETFTRLVRDRKLGYMALLRNLRNMRQAGVDEALVFGALQAGGAKNKALPFRFLSAAKAVPEWEPEIEKAMLAALGAAEPLPGRTVLLVDVSGSMEWYTAGKSDLTNMDAACSLAILAREVCGEVDVFSFSQEVKSIPPRRGMALRDAIVDSQDHGGTYLGMAVKRMPAADRLIVFTDEQAHDDVSFSDRWGHIYVVNVACYRNGVGYGRRVTHIDGFSEAVIDYMREAEKQLAE